MSYTVYTPYMILTADSLEHAHSIAHGGLDRIAAKRGYSMTVETLEDGSITYSVQNSKGRTVTGCRIVRSKSTRTAATAARTRRQYARAAAARRARV